ncbi:SA1362 family protein [Bacillus velezensis]|uniref:SA1362 family protein n=1 Tax=Bacillus velezensis TaxID=492670 RepID=UPI0021FC9FEB|nr:hypothetical protein NNL12_12400 [Bacillus velezensis]
MNHRVQPFFAVLIALGAFGFIYAAVTNPGQMISRAITVIIAGIIIYFIVRTVLNRRTGRDGTAFRKAARQSRLRMKEQKAKHRAGHRGRVSHLRSVPSSRPKPMILKKKSQTQLTVIEGKKNKKKNRALF